MPTPRFNIIANAMAQFEHASTKTSGSAKRPSRDISLLISGTPLPGLGALARLPPEIRNGIFSLVLACPRAMFIIPAAQFQGAFHLRERSDEAQQEATHTLQALGTVSHGMRQEARTLFYATKSFIILSYGYEYLPVFVRWLEAIGPDCCAALRSLCLPGYMWYRPSLSLTMQLHDLLRSCSRFQRLTVQNNIRHLCESCLPDLMSYLNYTGPEPHDGPLPLVDVSAWAKTIVSLTNLKWFRLDLIMSVDKENIKLCRERSYRAFSGERGRVLAEDVETRLRKEIDLRNPRRGIDLRVRYGGGDERSYRGAPW